MLWFTLISCSAEEPWTAPTTGNIGTGDTVYTGNDDFGSTHNDGPITVTENCHDSEYYLPYNAAFPYEPVDGETALRLVTIGYDEPEVYDYPNAPDVGMVLRVKTDQPIHLGLNSWTDTRWRIEEAVPGTIQGITLMGNATLPPNQNDLDIETDNLEQAWSVEWLWIGNREATAALEAHTGLPLASFHGCLKGSKMMLSDGDGEADPPADCETESTTGPPDVSMVTDLCPELADGEVVCLLIEGDEILALDPQTGQDCTLTTIDEAEEVSPISGSMMWSERELWFSAGKFFMAHQLSLATGTWKTHLSYLLSPLRLEDGGMLAMEVRPLSNDSHSYGSRMEHYASLRAVRCAEKEEWVYDTQLHYNTMATNGEHAFTPDQTYDEFLGEMTWYASRFSWPEMEYIDQIELPDKMDGWVSAVGDTLFMLNADSIRGYSTNTGSLRYETDYPETKGVSRSGLACAEVSAKKKKK